LESPAAKPQARKTRGMEERHAPVQTRLCPPPGEDTVGCQMEKFWQWVLFLIMYANLKSHSEFSNKRLGNFSASLSENTPKLFRRDFLPHKMLSEDMRCHILLVWQMTLRSLSVTLLWDSLCTVWDPLRSEFKGQNRKRCGYGSVSGYSSSQASQCGSREQMSMIDGLPSECRSFSGSASVNWWELMQ